MLVNEPLIILFDISGIVSKSRFATITHSQDYNRLAKPKAVIKPCIRDLKSTIVVIIGSCGDSQRQSWWRHLQKGWWCRGCIIVSFNRSGAETSRLQELGHYKGRWFSSGPKYQRRWGWLETCLFLHAEGLQPPGSSHCWENKRHAKVVLCFVK